MNQNQGYQGGYLPPQQVYPGYAYGGYPGMPPMPDYTLRRKAATRDLNRMALLTLLQFAASFLFGIILSLAMQTGGIGFFLDPVGYELLQGVLVLLSTPLPMLVYLLVSRADFVEYLRFERVGFLEGLLYVVGGLGVCLLANFPSMYLQDFFSQFGYQAAETMVTKESVPGIVLELLVVAVLVPVAEEFAFRGVIASRLRRHGMAFGVVGSALIFGMAHLDFPTVVFATICGFVFGFLYLKTRNLWLTIAIHALNNGISILMSHVNFFFGEEAGFVISNLLFFVPLLLGLAALVIVLIWKRRKIFEKIPSEVSGCLQPLNAGEGAGAMCSSWLLWALVGAMVLMTAASFLSW